MISEEALVKLMKEDERNAFSCLYDRYAAVLWGLILKVTTDKVLATEILEESFVNIIGRQHEFDHNKLKLLSWMVGITTQCVSRLSLSKTELMIGSKQVTIKTNHQQ